MKPTKFYTAHVLEQLCKVMQGVSDNIFPEHRPTISDKQMSDLLVISVESDSIDAHAYQKSYVQFELIAADRMNGVAHTKRLQEMCDALCERLPYAEKRFQVYHPLLMCKGQDSLGFTIWLIQADLFINTTDRYGD